MRLTAPLDTRPRSLAESDLELRDRADRVAAWWLRGPLTTALLTLTALQITAWLPQYLTWPWWADHDVFGTMALGWSRGLLPYRDLQGNNFPGTIYLFWIAGTLFGWGKTTPFYALDALLLLIFVVALLFWSRRRFGSRLPGAVGVLTVLGYVLELDYTLAAQRDLQAPMLTILAILSAEIGGGSVGPVLSGLLAAAGWSIRPQTVLLWPALAVALAFSAVRQSNPDQARKTVLLAWLKAGISLSIGLVAVLAPLAFSGVLDDFVLSIRESTLGDSYNRNSPLKFAAETLRQLSMRDVVTVLATLLLIGQAPDSVRRSATVWLVALGGVMLYRPLSPFPHAYLDHPRMLVSALNLALLVAMVREARALAPSLRLASVLAILALGSVLRPTFANPGASMREAHHALEGKTPWTRPMGYRQNGKVMTAAFYDWRDYRFTLAYLREHTRPETRIANALAGVPALCGPLARLPVFPAESIAWLNVRPDAEPAFARALESAEDAVVVWAPSEFLQAPRPGMPRVPSDLAPVIRRGYEFEIAFGPIEIWRRRP
jgi:hypothetical protein